MKLFKFLVKYINNQKALKLMYIKCGVTINNNYQQQINKTLITLALVILIKQALQLRSFKYIKNNFKNFKAFNFKKYSFEVWVLEFYCDTLESYLF